jgi:hypothetical protein
MTRDEGLPGLLAVRWTAGLAREMQRGRPVHVAQVEQLVDAANGLGHRHRLHVDRSLAKRLLEAGFRAHAAPRPGPTTNRRGCSSSTASKSWKATT